MALSEWGADWACVQNVEMPTKILQLMKLVQIIISIV